MRAVRRSAALLAALGVGLVAAYALMTSLRPADADDPDGPRLVFAPVERRTLRDVLLVRGTAAHPVLQTLKASKPGRVTGVRVQPGHTVQPGTPLLEIDGTPLVALAGERPLWRELTVGSEGVDVQQVETALAAAGHPPGTIDVRFTTATAAALNAWKAERGLTPDGMIGPGEVLVAPWPLRVGGVNVAVGDFVAPGADLVEVTRTDPVVALELSPGERVRALVGAEAVVELGPNRNRAVGKVASLAESPSRRSEGAQFYPGTVTLVGQPPTFEGTEARVEIVLATVADVLAVPAAAVILDGSGSPAVRIRRTGADGVKVVVISTGLQAGGFVEVKSGLDGSEEVVIEVRA